KTRRPVTRRGKGEGGFALLFIFLLAASISIMLYMQMPRVAFESQRDKEQLLVDRGEQYKRAIQLYYVKTKKFPQTIEDLENTNSVRFLRRRYIDPMTGKDEWRVIHVNAAGLLTDSLNEKAPGLDPTKDKDKDKTELATANPAEGPDLNPLARQRPSDRTPGSVAGGFPGQFPGAPTDPNQPPSSFADPNQPTGTQPGQFPPNGFPVGPNGQPVIPGVVQPGGVGYPTPGLPGTTQGVPPGWQPGQPLPSGVVPGTNGVPTGFPGAPGQPVGYLGTPGNPQAGGISPFQPGAFPQPVAQPGSPPPGTFGAGGNTPPNPALNLINQIITTPRQNPTQPTANAPSQFGAGGLAGFASTYKGTGIKLYKEHKKYQEWEFVFDLKELLGQQNQGGANQNNNPLGRPGSNQGTGRNNTTGTGSNNNGFSFGGGQGAPTTPTTPTRP
ncbi:MAG: hypothetical protein ABI823_04170, partial [Bryobacteraceae bacterium]